jgi:hypothetical protein
MVGMSQIDPVAIILGVVMLLQVAMVEEVSWPIRAGDNKHVERAPMQSKEPF